MRRITKIFVAFLWVELVVFLVGLKPILGYIDGADVVSKLSLIGLSATIATSVILALALHTGQGWANFASYFYALLHFAVLGPIGLAFGLTGVMVTWYQINSDTNPDHAAPGQGKPEISAQDRMVAVLAALTQLVTAIGGWWWVTDYAARHKLPALSSFELVSCLVVCLTLTIITHEMGHVVGAIAGGMRFRKLCVGPLVVSNLADGWHFHWTQAMTLSGGYAIAAPKSEHDLRGSVLLFVAGGAASTLIVGVAAWSGFLLAVQSGASGPAVFLGLLGVWMLASFAVNVLPYRGTRGFSDGARLIQLVTSQPEGEKLLKIMKIAMSECTPLRPREWRQDWLDGLLDDPHSPAYMRGCYCRYVSALDSGQTGEAAKWLNLFLEVPRTNPHHNNAFAFALEGAYFEARYRGNAEAADAWLKVPAGESPVERPTILRAQAAVQVITGKRELSHKTIAQARTFVVTSEQTGWTLFELDRLDDLERWAESSEDLNRLRRAVDASKSGSHAAGDRPQVGDQASKS